MRLANGDREPRGDDHVRDVGSTIGWPATARGRARTSASASGVDATCSLGGQWHA